MEIDDQAFLDQIEQNIRSQSNEKEVAEREAQQRAAEMERIRKATANLPSSAVPKKSASAKPAPATEAKKNPLEDDPRYKEYFERLRRQKGEAPAQPSAGTAGATKSSTPVPGKAAESQVVGPGAIVRFDDGSIGVYKDAVSGRDYALFYFLHPDGQFEPEGVFLQSYQAKVIGNLPENYFADLRDKNTWDRDLIVFHLSRYEHVNFLNNVAEHEERKPKNTTPVRQQQPMASAPATEPAPQKPAIHEEQKPAQQAPQQTPGEQQAPKTGEATPKQNDTLVKGRRFEIVFGGKKWEAVYWTSDENGAIVAHSTHGDWSLMRLDLERFKDSLKLGEVVDSDTINAIAESAGKS